MSLGSVKQLDDNKIFHNHIVLSVLFLYNHNHITNKKTSLFFAEMEEEYYGKFWSSFKGYPYFKNFRLKDLACVIRLVSQLFLVSKMGLQNYLLIIFTHVVKSSGISFSEFEELVHCIIPKRMLLKN